MLNGITNTGIQQSQLEQTSATDKTGLFAKKNPFEKTDSSYLIDEMNISTDAVKMYQRDKDIKQFSKLALSDPNDTSHNSKVAEQIENGQIQFGDKDVVNSLFSNSSFMQELFG